MGNREDGQQGFGKFRERSIDIVPSLWTVQQEYSALRIKEEHHCPLLCGMFHDALQNKKKSEDIEPEVQLMFDEIKLKSGVWFNCVTNDIYGFAASKNANKRDCNPDDENRLEDTHEYIGAALYANVYRARTATNQTHNVAYFLNCGSLDGDSILKQILHVITCCEMAGLKVTSLVSDAEKLLKASKWSLNRKFSDICKPNASRNDNLYYSLYCPWVEEYEKPGNKIQWTAIEALYNHIESNHAQSRNFRKLPHVKLDVVKLDNWKKVNVHYAKLVYEADTIDYPLNLLRENTNDTSVIGNDLSLFPAEVIDEDSNVQRLIDTIQEEENDMFKQFAKLSSIGPYKDWFDKIILGSHEKKAGHCRGNRLRRDKDVSLYHNQVWELVQSKTLGGLIGESAVNSERMGVIALVQVLKDILEKSLWEGMQKKYDSDSYKYIELGKEIDFLSGMRIYRSEAAFSERPHDIEGYRKDREGGDMRKQGVVEQVSPMVNAEQCSRRRKKKKVFYLLVETFFIDVFEDVLKTFCAANTAHGGLQGGLQKKKVPFWDLTKYLQVYLQVLCQYHILKSFYTDHLVALHPKTGKKCLCLKTGKKRPKGGKKICKLLSYYQPHNRGVVIHIYPVSPSKQPESTYAFDSTYHWMMGQAGTTHAKEDLPTALSTGNTELDSNLPYISKEIITRMVTIPFLQSPLIYASTKEAELLPILVIDTGSPNSVTLLNSDFLPIQYDRTPPQGKTLLATKPKSLERDILSGNQRSEWWSTRQSANKSILYSRSYNQIVLSTKHRPILQFPLNMMGNDLPITLAETALHPNLPIGSINWLNFSAPLGLWQPSMPTPPLHFSKLQHFQARLMLLLAKKPCDDNARLGYSSQQSQRQPLTASTVSPTGELSISATLCAQNWKESLASKLCTRGQSLHGRLISELFWLLQTADEFKRAQAEALGLNPDDDEAVQSALDDDRIFERPVVLPHAGIDLYADDITLHKIAVSNFHHKNYNEYRTYNRAILLDIREALPPAIYYARYNNDRSYTPLSVLTSLKARFCKAMSPPEFDSVTALLNSPYDKSGIIESYIMRQEERIFLLIRYWVIQTCLGHMIALRYLERGIRQWRDIEATFTTYNRNSWTQFTDHFTKLMDQHEADKRKYYYLFGVKRHIPGLNTVQFPLDKHNIQGR
eukprot:jgi/Psemu1/18199/gm1.18199_g